MPLKFWDEAFLTATHLINLLPSKVINYQTPFEKLFLEKPKYNSLHIFGCAVWPNLRPYNSRKLAFRSTRCVFLGYSSMHKGYKCLEPSTGRVYISRDVVFDESIFPFSELYPNARALLQKEVLLWPHHLLSFGDQTSTDQMFTNPVPEAHDLQEDTGESGIQNDGVAPVNGDIQAPGAAEDPGVRSQGDPPTAAGERSQEDPGSGSGPAGASPASTRGGGCKFSCACACSSIRCDQSGRADADSLPRIRCCFRCFSCYGTS